MRDFPDERRGADPDTRNPRPRNRTNSAGRTNHASNTNRTEGTHSTDASNITNLSISQHVLKAVSKLVE